MYACLIETVDGAKICYYNDKFELAVSPRIADFHLQSECYDYNFYEGLALYCNPKTHKFGYIDKTGNMVIPEKYEWAGAFSEGVAPAYRNSKYSFIDTTGKVKLS